jgi:ABC-type polysaccharide/polyol phosphate transport system ATPase subunit
MNLLTVFNGIPKGMEDPPDSEILIRLEGVSVRYRLPRDRIASFKEYAILTLQRRIRYDDFWALSDISLEVRKGELLGIIGLNGAGKSTLLKVISRVLKPTRGRVWVCGRVAPLLELGAGFHAELTGRENVFLNGLLLGYSHAEITNHFQEILDFADISGFIDAPLRTYSTGMVARLGFAVATMKQPDILIVDEVLSVGDEQFQRKCHNRLAEFRENGATTLLVSHNTDLVAMLCNRVAWLDHGHLRMLGDTADIVDPYRGGGAR